MLGICANYAHHAFAMDHLALITNFSDRRADFHNFTLLVPVSYPAPI